MNALYVTVSIPLLLVLAGFNHAHGLTTFGKTNTQGTQQDIKPTAQPRLCTSQANCTFIKGTTCLKQNCLCGDNTNPVNGICKAKFKGPKHLCAEDTDCTENAICTSVKDKNKTINSAPNDPLIDKTCQCQEGFIELTTMCAGASTIGLLPGLISIIFSLVRTLN